MTIAAVNPTTRSDRIGELDIIRGFALFGVLWMNLFSHAGMVIPADAVQTLPTAPIDEIVTFFTRWLAAGKAQALFSLLFGFGFAILMDRSEARGANATAIYLRRLTILLVIGIAHFLLLWMGDILHAYAALGFLLLLTRRWPGWLLVGLGVLLSVGGTVALFAYNQAITPAGQQPASAIVMDAGQALRWQLFQTADYSAYVAELVRASWVELYSQPIGPVFLGWIFGRFLIGAWIYRQGWLQDSARYAPQFRRSAAILLIAGLVMAGLRPMLGLMEVKIEGLAQYPMRLIGSASLLVLALGYGAGIVVLCQRAQWRARLSGLGAVGQMALTNYLMQSLVFFFVLYGFGLGLLPYAGSTFCLGLALIVFALQIVFSRRWLARYRFGPAEWLWRSATYGKRQPMRIERTGAPEAVEA